MKRQTLGEVLKRIWKMAAPYWVYSDERVSSWLILALNIGVMILSNFAGLRMTAWNRDWLNAFNNRDSRMWVQNIWVFLVIGGIMMLTSNFNVYVTSWINIRWRRWMTALHASVDGRRQPLQNAADRYGHRQPRPAYF